MIQVSSLSKKGIKCCYISAQQHDKNIKEEVMSGQYPLVYFTPETILTNKKWRCMLLSEVYCSHLRVVVIDEAHNVKKW